MTGPPAPVKHPAPVPSPAPSRARFGPAPGRGKGRAARLPFPAMTFRPESLRGATADNGAGQIDYRLARKMVVDQFHAGRLSRVEVCDAHPELLRAARNVGEATAEDCPICEESKVVLVSYAFGPAGPRWPSWPDTAEIWPATWSRSARSARGTIWPAPFAWGVAPRP